MECLRVDQLDANVLDGEIQNIVYSGLDEFLGTLPAEVHRSTDKVKPELRLLLDAVLWSTRVYTGASPGQNTMELYYKDYTKSKVKSHFALSVLLPYLMERVPEVFNSPHWSQKMAKLGAFAEIFKLLHYLNFLRSGGHSTVTEQFLGLRNWTKEPPVIGTVNYDNQNRELLWHAFRDLLLLIWPAVRVADKWWRERNRDATASARDGVCTVCAEETVTPIDMTCGHRACYWCVTAPGFSGKCPICKEEVEIRVARGVKIN